LKVHIHHFSNVKSQKEVTNKRSQGFSYYLGLMIEGSGSRAGPVTLTNGSGSRRPKNIWIRICNTGYSNYASRPLAPALSGLVLHVFRGTVKLVLLHSAKRHPQPREDKGRIFVQPDDVLHSDLGTLSFPSANVICNFLKKQVERELRHGKTSTSALHVTLVALPTLLSLFGSGSASKNLSIFNPKNCF
jgi:hypothetical protein